MLGTSSKLYSVFSLVHLYHHILSNVSHNPQVFLFLDPVQISLFLHPSANVFIEDATCQLSLMPLKICLCKIHDFNLASVAFFHNSEHLSSFNGFVSSHCAYFLKVHNINNLCAITFQTVFSLSPHACFHHTSVLFDLCSSSHTYFHYACLLKDPQSFSLVKSLAMKARKKIVHPTTTLLETCMSKLHAAVFAQVYAPQAHTHDHLLLRASKCNHSPSSFLKTLL